MKREYKGESVGHCLSCRKVVYEQEDFRQMWWKGFTRVIHAGCLKNPEIEKWNMTVREDREAQGGGE